MKDNAVLLHILKGFIPYTKENIALAYKPHRFFRDLEKISRAQTGKHISQATIKTTYYRAKKQGYFTIGKEGAPHITEKGHRKLELYAPQKLKDAKLLVTFDIRETDRHKRTELRSVLRILKFKQVQRSVWVSSYDGRQILQKEIKRLNIQDSVILYEAYDITKPVKK